jgi:hypothetical protein
MPSLEVVQPDKYSERIDAELQSLFCLGVCMLFYFTKHSRPDISNVVRELSKYG